MADTTKAELAKAGGPDITRLLQPGEQVLWQGQGKMMNRATRRVVAIIFIPLFYIAITTGLLLWLTFDVFFIGDTSGFLLIFICMLAGIIGVGVLLLSAQRKRAIISTYYWLTNHQAIIIKKPASSNDYTTTVIDLAATDAVKMIERGDGSGTLVFGRNAISAYSPATRSYASNEADYSFSDIPRVVEVYGMVQEAQAEARRARGV